MFLTFNRLMLGVLLLVCAPAFAGDTSLTMERVATTGYVSGATLDITLTLSTQGAGNLVGLGVEETLPPGWTFDSIVAGDAPAFAPTTPVNFVEFVWDPAPATVHLTYRVKVPTAQSGTKTISGRAVYRVLGLPGEQSTGPVNTEVVPSTLPLLSVTPSQRELIALATSTTVAVQTSADWTAASNQGWATLSSTAGAGNATLTINATANTGAQRSATITITGTGTSPESVAVLIIQANAGAPPLVVTPANREISADAGSANFSIQTSANWTATSNQAWARTATERGQGTATLTVNCTENTGVARSATITILGTGTSPGNIAVTISQAAKSTSTLAVTPASRSISAAGGSSTFSIETSAAWTIDSSEPWASVSPTTGSGNTILTVSCPASFGPQRQATLTVYGAGTNPANVAVIITQDANPITPTLDEVVQYTFDNFRALDITSRGGLLIDEIRTVFPMLTETQFDQFDTDGDGFATEAELQTYLNGNIGGGCAGCAVKSSNGFRSLYNHLGDALVLSISLGLLCALERLRNYF